MQFHTTEFYLSDTTLTTQNQIEQLLWYCYNACILTGVFFPLEQMLLQSQNKPGSVMGKRTQTSSIRFVLLGT